MSQHYSIYGKYYIPSSVILLLYVKSKYIKFFDKYYNPLFVILIL